MQEKVIFQWHVYFFCFLYKGLCFSAMKIIQLHLLYIFFSVGLYWLSIFLILFYLTLQY